MALRLVCGLALVCGVVCMLTAGAGSVRAAGPTPQPEPIGGIVPPIGPHRAATPETTPTVTYHGGPVMHSNTTYAIFWLPSGYSFGSNTANFESTVEQYFSDVSAESGTHGNVYSVDPEYYDTLSGGYQYAQYASTFGGAMVDTNPFPANGCTDPTTHAYPTCLTEQQEATELFSDIGAKGWPYPNLNAEYFLFTPQNVTTCDDGTNSSCAYQAYCAYHSYLDYGGQPIVWANIPWAAGTTQCDEGLRPTGSDADPTLSLVSHEHNESITDPELDAWFDGTGNEIADECAWNFGPMTNSANQTINGHNYLLQQEWDNSTGTCVQSFTPPTPTITSLTPTSGASGTTVTIQGSGFVTPGAVKFNGQNASSFTIVSPLELTATPAAGATSGPVTVVTPGGTASSPGNFTLAPAITSFSPAGATAGTSVTITGTNFTGATAVSFNGTPATTYTVNSATQVTATVPPGATSGPISVTTGAGTGTSSTSFDVLTVPTVTGFTPTSGGAGATVTVTGSGFDGVTSVTFNGLSALGYSVLSDTELMVTVPVGATTGTIAVSTLGGTGTSSGSFTVIPAPTITGFTPTSGGISTSVTITGTNFAGATAVSFDGTPASMFTVLSDTQIAATVASGSSSGTISVTTPGGVATASGSFTVYQPPMVTGFTPTSGPVGTSVTVTGTNFTGATAVTIGGAAAGTFTVSSATQIIATVAAGAVTGRIDVTTPGGVAISGGTYTVTPPPTIAGFTPTSGPVGTSVTITGTSLTGATAVTVGGTEVASFSVGSDTQITATVAAGTSSGTVAVTTPAGTGTSSGSFTVVPPPTITGFTPTSGPAGTSVTIAGTTFTGTTAVAFAGVNAASFTVDSATQITAVVPAGTRTGTITVTTPAGTGTSSSSFTFVQPPSISYFSPLAGPTGTSVTISGNNLTGATAVEFNGTAASSFTVNSGTQITATVAGGTTSGPITITGPGGTTTSSSNFTVVPPPTITGFTPSSGLVGTSVTITGTNLTSTYAVWFGASETAATSFTVNSDTQVTAVVAPGTTSGPVFVETYGGWTYTGAYFTVLQPPTISGFTPPSGPTGTSVTVTGTNLTTASSVTFNGAAATFTVNSDSQLTARVPAGATSGTITVTTQGGTVTSSGSFTVIPAPTLTSFSPTSGPVGTSVTLTGANLSGATAVTFHGKAAASYTVNSSTQITATVAAGTTSGTIAVTTPGGSVTSSGSFTVIPAPAVSGFSPASGPTGTSVTITGTSFTAATAVTFGGTAAASFTVDSDTQITATVAAGTASGTVAVTTAAGTGTSSGSFTVLQPPTISGFTPTSGGVGSGVTITGTNLTGATAVTFNGTEAASYTVDSATQITAVVATGATSGAIAITTPGGSATSADSFTVIPAPTVSGFLPTSGPVGTSVTISGTNLTGATAVTFNGTAATSFSVDSLTQITAVVAAGTTSGTIAVTTPGGTAVSSGSFTVVPAPTISGFSPTNGPAGTNVTIRGANLAGATAVAFGGTPAASFAVISNTQIAATVGTDTSGPITVVTAAGTATSSDSFIITQPPTVSAFIPTSGPVGTNVTIHGTNLSDATAVSFNGTPAASYVAISATQVDATVASGTTSGTITVVTLGGTATSTDAFTVIPAPTVTSFSPTSGLVGASVTITGTGLTAATAVSFGGTSAASFTVDSDTQITAVVASGTSSGAIAVTTSGGSATSSDVFTVLQPPTISDIFPAHGVVGTPVEIDGTNLGDATAVAFDGTVASSFTVDSASEITATVAPGTTSGTVSVTTPGGQATSSQTFTVDAQPTIASFSPTAAASGTTVTIMGTNLNDPTAVTFGGVAATSFVPFSDTEILAAVGSGATGTIQVTTPGGTATSTQTFTYVPAPTVTGFTPASGSVGTHVTITGTDLDTATAVAFDGTAAASFTVDSATQITATVAAGTALGTIAVTTLGGTATSSDSFTVIASPTISGFTPTSGPAGTSVTITGTNLTGATAVTFGGADAGSFTVDSATQITATVAAGTTSGAIAVTTPGGTATSSGTFTAIQAPAISGFTPTSGAAGTSVAITGTNLTGATAVQFDGTAAASFTVNSATQITATVASGSSSGTISVTTPGGTAVSSGSFTIVGPTVSSFTPANGPVGTSVTIDGSGFVGVTAVAFGGMNAAGYTVESNTQIVATVAVGTTSGPVSVSTLDGTGTSSSSFAVVQAPTISSFSPTSGPVGGSVTITGTNLTGATAVSFDGRAAQSYVVDSATQISAVVAWGTTTGAISVTTPGGTATSSGSFTVIPAPAISGFSPTSGPTGTSVTISGFALTGATAVTFNGAPAASFTIDSDTQITATVAADATSGKVDVTTPSGTAVSTDSFTVVAQPQIFSFAPRVVAAGTSVTISGSGLTGATAVSFNGTPAASFTVDSDDQITATVAPGTTSGTVSVTTPTGTATSSGSLTVEVVPTISSFTPTIGVADTSVTISGSGFTGATGVAFDGIATGSWSIVSDSQITAYVPVGATTGPVSVTTLAGTGTSTDSFVVAAAPQISGFTPTSGPVGTTVTISGSGFTGATAVSFDGIPAASFAVASDTQITATVADGTGSGGVSVTTPGGVADSSDDFNVYATPTISSFTPTSGPSGTYVVISGSGLAGATGVSFGGTPAAAFSIIGDTALGATVAPGTASGPITVTTPGGTATSSADFSVVPPPTIASLDPENGPVGTSVTITGSDLTGATSVKFDGTAARSFSVESATTITATVAAGTASGVVTVTTPAGTATSADAFTVTASPPAITGFTPQSGGAGTLVEIDGTNLSGATAVSFGGTPADSFTVVDDATIDATVGNGGSGQITVTTPAGTATSSGTFTYYATPVIDSFSPSSGSVGTSVTITGSGFTGATEVDFDLVPVHTFNVDSDTQITATVPSDAATGVITVINPAGFADSSGSFTVVGQPAPVVASFAPTSGVVGATVTITGSNLSGASAVEIGGAEAASFTVVSDSEITAVVAGGTTSGHVAVTTPGGTATSGGSFTVLQSPTVDSFAPTSGAVGATITITGSNLTGATAVQIGGTEAASFTVVSDAEITAVVAGGTTSGQVEVTTPGGTATSAGSFSVLQPPTVDSFAPTSGRAGDQVTITGTNLDGATAVSFGATPAASFTVDSATQIAATVPDGATSGAITVVTPDGTGTSAGSFTVFSTAAPAIRSFSPAKGNVGTKVTITGTGFAGATSVDFGGVSAVPATVSSTTITVLVPAGATSDPLTVTTPTGGAGESAASFWMTPAVASFTPTGGPDGTEVTILGSGFDGATAVTFNTTKAASFTVVDDGRITATVAPGTKSGNVTVTTPGGSARSVAKYSADAIATLAPSKGGAGTRVTITGVGFTGATAVRFNGTPAASFTVSGDTKIVAVVAAGTTSGPVTVRSPAGTMTSAVSFGMPAHIDSFSPSIAAAGSTVTILGSGFTGATAVKFNGVAASGMNVVSDTKITATIAPKTTSGAISVVTPGGTVSSSTKLTIVGVSMFSPTKGLAGTTVTITGLGFSDATAVKFNGNPAASFTILSDTKITAVVASGTTTGQVSVQTSHGTATSTASFGIVPTVASFAPAEAPIGSTVTIHGAGFTGATAVKFGGVAASDVNVVDDTKITATIAAKTTTGAVSVTTPGGTATSATKLAIVGITTFAPTKGVSGNTVTISGSGLTGATQVLFSGTAAAAFTVVSDTKITAVVADGTTSGTISVETPHGTVTSTASFGIVPAVSAFNPAEAPVGATVTIQGSGFTGATGVKVGGKAASDVTVVDDGTITATIPAGTTSGTVSVTTPGGTATSKTKLTIVAVTGLSPSRAVAGSTVTISGVGFTGATAVRFNGTDADSFSVVSDTKITAVVAVGTTSGAISVDTAFGTATSTASFSVAPSITSAAPAPASVGENVTINGSGFTGATVVKVNGKVATNVQVVSDTEITATIAAGTTTGYVTVTTPAGTATSQTKLTVVSAGAGTEGDPFRLSIWRLLLGAR